MMFVISLKRLLLVELLHLKMLKVVRIIKKPDFAIKRLIYYEKSFKMSTNPSESHKYSLALYVLCIFP